MSPYRFPLSTNFQRKVLKMGTSKSFPSPFQSNYSILQLSSPLKWMRCARNGIALDYQLLPLFVLFLHLPPIHLHWPSAADVVGQRCEGRLRTRSRSPLPFRISPSYPDPVLYQPVFALSLSLSLCRLIKLIDSPVEFIVLERLASHYAGGDWKRLRKDHSLWMDFPHTQDSSAKE